VSAYGLNKMIRDFNRDPQCRQRYAASPAEFVGGYDVSPEEAAAFLANDVRDLYKLGVHGLILRPFTIINKMSETDYLEAIRG
jgi:Aromatic-ring-opening dioxygenase LigAB, LigA subunit